LQICQLAQGIMMSPCEGWELGNE